MPVYLALLAHYLSQHLAIICGPVDLSISSKFSSPVESSEPAVKDNFTLFATFSFIYITNTVLNMHCVMRDFLK